MRIAVVSDIHGNLTALQAVVQDLRKHSPDGVFQLGDLVANGARPAEVFDWMFALGWKGVYGNTDEMLWAPEILNTVATRFPSRKKLREVLINEIGPVVRGMLGEMRLATLKKLPPHLREGKFFFCHASPSSTWVSPREGASDAEFEEAYGTVEEQVVVYGHIHTPFVRKTAGKVIVNTGSVSLSYDGDYRASYVLLEENQVIHRRVEYDVQKERRLILESSLPRREWLATILTTAKYQDPF